MDDESLAEPIPPFDNELFRRLDPLGTWVVETYFDAEVEGLDRLPDGPALLVGNHNAGIMIPEGIIFVHQYLHHYGLEDAPVALGHQLLFRIPLLADLCRSLSIVPACRENALSAFEQDRKVLVYPGGDWEAMRPSRHRDRIDFGGRNGFVQLAMDAGVPIVPVVAAGAHDGWYVLTRGDKIASALALDRLLRIKVFPIAIAAPTGVVAGPVAAHIPIPHKIIVEALEPIELEGQSDNPADVEQARHTVVSTMQRRLDALAQRLPRCRMC